MMKAIAKKPSSDHLNKKKSDAAQEALKSSHAVYSNPQVPIVQLKPICPCEGGCPRCKRVIQSKLKIGQPNDIYEQEADRVADIVMRMAEGSEVRSQNSELRNKEEAVQRKSTCPFSNGPSCGEEDEIKRKPVVSKNFYAPLIQRQFVTPLGPGGGFGGLMDRDRRRAFEPQPPKPSTSPSTPSIVNGPSCLCERSTRENYDQTTYQFIRSIRPYIRSISSSEGVSPNPVAGAIADEYDTRRNVKSVIDGLQDAILDALPESFIDVDRFFDIHNKLLNTLENDVGPANIKVRTALELVQRGELQAHGSPPSDIQVNRIIDFLLTEWGTVKTTATVIRKAQDIFGNYMGDYPDFLWEAVLVEYFKQGDSYYNRFMKARSANPNHDICPGDGGCRFIQNWNQIRSALTPTPGVIRTGPSSTMVVPDIEAWNRAIQRKSIDNSAEKKHEASPDFESCLNSLGDGQPLPKSVRAYFEPRFGYDFSQVRVHIDSDAIQMSRELNAEAFTYGRDIYFGAGRYSPGTLSGKRLLSHELTHVAQQNTATIVRQELPGPMSLPPQPPQTLGPTTPSERGQIAVAIALGEVGVRENPPGSNRGACPPGATGGCVDAYTGGRAQPWCAHFVSWAFEQTGFSPFGHIAAVNALRSWGRSQGWYVDRSAVERGVFEPMAGDILTEPRYDSTGALVGGHTGMVVRFDRPSRLLETVEGNRSDAVVLGSRLLNELDGFIRIGT